MLMSAVPADAFSRARITSNPAASADAFKVYCAVVASDSRMRRAMVSRNRERGAAFACCRGRASYSLRTSSSRIRPPGPEPAIDAG